MARSWRTGRRGDGALHTGALELRRAGRGRSDPALSHLSPQAAGQHDLRHLIANDGLVSRGARTRLAHHPAKREVARGYADSRRTAARLMGLSRPGHRRRQLEQPVCAARSVRSGTGPCKGLRSHLADDARLLEVGSNPDRRLIRLLQGRQHSGHRKHDLRRDFVAGDRRRPNGGRRCRGQRRSRAMLRQSSRRRIDRANRSRAPLVGTSLFRAAESATRTAERRDLALLLSLRRRARRPLDRPAIHRRSRLVSRRGGLSLQPEHPADRRELARRRRASNPIRTSPRASPYCFSAKAAGRS